MMNKIIKLIKTLFLKKQKKLNKRTVKWIGYSDDTKFRKLIIFLKNNDYTGIIFKILKKFTWQSFVSSFIVLIYFSWLMRIFLYALTENYIFIVLISGIGATLVLRIKKGFNEENITRKDILRVFIFSTIFASLIYIIKIIIIFIIYR